MSCLCSNDLLHIAYISKTAIRIFMYARNQLELHYYQIYSEMYSFQCVSLSQTLYQHSHNYYNTLKYPPPHSKTSLSFMSIYFCVLELIEREWYIYLFEYTSARIKLYFCILFIETSYFHTIANIAWYGTIS